MADVVNDLGQGWREHEHSGIRWTLLGGDQIALMIRDASGQAWSANASLEQLQACICGLQLAKRDLKAELSAAHLLRHMKESRAKRK